jgi:arylsulfatase A-like enzyme
MIERLETANAQMLDEFKKQLAEIKKVYSSKIEEMDKRVSDLMKQLEKIKE